jgi:hypothetical protein
VNTDHLIFSTVFLDRDVDIEIRAHARRLQAKPGSIYRLFLEAGLAQLTRGATLPAASTDALVLRTAFLTVASDERLTGLACRLRTDKSELTRRVTKQGMLAIQAALESRPPG